VLFRSALALVLALGAAVLLAGYWLPACDDLHKLSPEHPADALVPLGGSWARPPHAADIFSRGLARQVWVPRPVDDPEARFLTSAGVYLPKQEEVYRRLLVKGGVPETAIRYFGEGLVSTAAEARAFAAAAGQPARVLLVTSPYHVRRARLAFSRALPESEVLVSATPHEPYPRHWWSTQQSAQKTIMELAKLTFYLLGGEFDSASFAPQAPKDGGPAPEKAGGG
jgi:uncharacterized SAM-binding protein YcdF (DUF218 family)